MSKLLGIDKLSGPTSSREGNTTRCGYGGSESITITIIVDATSKTLDSIRKTIELGRHLQLVELSPPGAMKAFPGFGDKALYREIEMPIVLVDIMYPGQYSPKPPKINSIAVLKGKTLIYLASKAPLQKVRDLETALLKDLGAL